MKSASIALAFAAALSLASCSRDGEGPGRADAATFGPVNRESIDPPQDRRYRLTVTSVTEARWAHASEAMGEDCADGEDSVDIEISPEYPPGEFMMSFPAGTTFTRSFRCEPPYPGEILLDSDVDIDAAMALVEARLAGGPREWTVIVPLGFADTPNGRKYPTIESWLGDVAADAHIRCEGGPFTMRNVIADWGSDARTGQFRTGAVVVGTAFHCLEGADSAMPASDEAADDHR